MKGIAIMKRMLAMNAVGNLGSASAAALHIGQAHAASLDNAVIVAKHAMRMWRKRNIDVAPQFSTSNAGARWYSIP